MAQLSKANGPKVAHFPQGKQRKWGGENSQPLQAGATYPQVTRHVDHSSLDCSKQPRAGNGGKVHCCLKAWAPASGRLWRGPWSYGGHIPQPVPGPPAHPPARGPRRPRGEGRHPPLTALSASRTTLRLTVGEAGPLSAAVTVM